MSRAPLADKMLVSMRNRKLDSNGTNNGTMEWTYVPKSKDRQLQVKLDSATQPGHPDPKVAAISLFSPSGPAGERHRWTGERERDIPYYSQAAQGLRFALIGSV